MGLVALGIQKARAVNPIILNVPTGAACNDIPTSALQWATFQIGNCGIPESDAVAVVLAVAALDGNMNFSPAHLWRV